MNRHRSATRTLVWVAVAVTAVLLSAAGMMILVTSVVTTMHTEPAPADGGGSPVAVRAAEQPAPQDPAAQPASDSMRATGPDVSAGGELKLDPLEVTAPVLPATVPNGVLTPPHDVSAVGIWAGGAPLAAATGTTVIAGHVNLAGQGPGALHDLPSLRPGQIVHTVDPHGGVDAWRVTAVTARAKSSGVDPTIWGGLAGPRRLVVVTCGGELEYDSGSGDYRDNVYMYAEPLPE